MRPFVVAAWVLLAVCCGGARCQWDDGDSLDQPAPDEPVGTPAPLIPIFGSLIPTSPRDGMALYELEFWRRRHHHRDPRLHAHRRTVQLVQLAQHGLHGWLLVPLVLHVPISPGERMQNGCLRRACRRLPRQSWSPYLSKARHRRVSVHHHHRHHRHTPRPKAAAGPAKTDRGAPVAVPPMAPHESAEQRRQRLCVALAHACKFNRPQTTTGKLALTGAKRVKGFLRRELEAKLKLEVGKHIAKPKCVEIGEREIAAAAAAHGRCLRSQHVDPMLQRLLDLNTQESLQDSRLFVLRSSETTRLFTEDSRFASHIRALQRDCSNGSVPTRTCACAPTRTVRHRS